VSKLQSKTGIHPRIKLEDIKPSDQVIQTQTSVSAWDERRVYSLEKNKADKNYVSLEFKHLIDKYNIINNEVSMIKESSKKCLNEKELIHMNNGIRENTKAIRNTYETFDQSIKDAYKNYIKVLTAILLFFITTGGTGIWYLAQMSSDVKNNKSKVEHIEKEIKSYKQDKDDNKKEKDEIKELIKDAILDARVSYDEDLQK